MIELITISHADNNPGDISMQVNLPIGDARYCIEILQMLDKIKQDIIKKISLANNEKLKVEKGFLYKTQQLFGKKMSEKDKEMLNADLNKLNEAEKTGQSIQGTLNNLAKALGAAQGEERILLIKDINAAITNIIGGA